MMHFISVLIILFLSFILSTASVPRAECSANYRLCAPRGVSTRDIPEVGPGLRRLFLELLYTVNPGGPELEVRTTNNGPIRRETSGSICCAETTECLVLQSYLIPYCWDQFTTDYYLPDGSYGTLANGSYMSAAGDVVNLISGEYTLRSGMTGNIYDGDAADKPDTSKLPMPTQFTSSGIGTAIPASELGGVMTTSTMSSETFTGGVSTMATPASTTSTGYPAYGSTFNTTNLAGITTGTGGTGLPSMTMAYTSTVITPPISNGVTRWKANYFTTSVLLFLIGLSNVV